MVQCIRTPEIKKLRKVLLRHNVIVVNASDRIWGKIIIKSYRKYDWEYNGRLDEVDIEFHGLLNTGGSIEPVWRGPEKRFSRIRVNRILRRNLIGFINTYLAVFNINLRVSDQIKKIKWIHYDPRS